MNHPYTVILIYPDYIAEQYGGEFWLDHVEAETPALAASAAQANAALAVGDCDPADFALVALFEGHHNDLSHIAYA